MVRDQYREEVITPGDRASQLAKEVCSQSHKNCPAVEVVPHQPGNFRGPVGFRWRRYILEAMLAGAVTMEVENDGAGGKPQFFTLIGLPEAFWNLGWEIITMNVDDIARSGRFPAVMTNELNAKRITENNFHLVEAALRGYGAALKRARLVNITGETAVMKHSITAFCDTGSLDQLILTWGGTCIGLAHQDLLIDGSKIRPDMPIVGFWEPGYRCNGGTFFTELLLVKFGPEISMIMANQEAIAFVKKLAVPSLSYAGTITRFVGWNPDGSIGEPRARIAGIAHITGGGVWGKFKELLPDGVGALLNKMPFPARVLSEAQELSWNTESRLSDWQAYGTLHGGCGMLLVVEPGDELTVIQEARDDDIQAMIVGRTTSSQNREVVIHSRFKEGRVLSSERPE